MRKPTSPGGRGRRHRTPLTEPAAPATPQQQLAETMEAMFLAHGRTLTDPQTAEAYRITLEAVTLMHDGAHDEGILGDQAHESLRGMIEGMAGSPNIL